MNPVKFSDLLLAVHGTPVDSFTGEQIVRRICTDSRQVQAGDLFWAIRGERFDGHDFVASALEQGAVACIVGRNQCKLTTGPLIVVEDTVLALQEFAAWYRRTLETLVIGVTGSVGKTTTRELIYQVLSQRFLGIRSQRNFNNEIGVPLTLLQLNSDHEFAVVEMGARHQDDIARLCEIAQPEVGVITAISEAHLETFGSLAEIRRAKGELFEALPPGGFGILAGEPAKTAGLANRAICPVLRVGVEAASDLRATEIFFHQGVLEFQVDGDFYRANVPGRHFLTNVLCAIGVAREIGLSPDEIRHGLAEFHPVSGRTSAEHVGEWMVIDDTYNASPASMRGACELLQEFEPANKRILVLGDMLELGVDSSRLHRELGQQIGASRIDRLIAYGTYSGELVAGALEAGLHAHQLAQASGMETLCLVLDCWLEPNDVVLVKGSRGMQMERVIAWLRDQVVPKQTSLQIKEGEARESQRACA